MALMQPVSTSVTLSPRTAAAPGGFAEKAPGGRGKAGAGAGCTAPPGGAAAETRYEEVLRRCRELLMKITLVGMGSGLPGHVDCAGLAGPANGRADSGGTAAAAKPAGWLYPPTASQFTSRKKCWTACRRSRCPDRRAGLQRGYRLLFRCCSAGAQAAGTGGGSNGAARGFPAYSCWPRRWAGRGRTGTLSAPTDVACAPAAECRSDRPTFFLTGGRNTSPAALCEILAAAGFGAVQATVGENLGLPRSKSVMPPIRRRRWRGGSFAPLSVLLVEAAAPSTAAPRARHCRTKRVHAAAKRR